MILAAMLALVQAAQPAREPYEQVPVTGTRNPIYLPDRLGSGPHILVISDGNGMTRVPYRTGPACQRARDSVRRQVAPPPDTRSRIYGPPATRAFCVPR